MNVASTNARQGFSWNALTLDCARPSRGQSSPTGKKHQSKDLALERQPMASTNAGHEMHPHWTALDRHQGNRAPLEKNINQRTWRSNANQRTEKDMNQTALDRHRSDRASLEKHTNETTAKNIASAITNHFVGTAPGGRRRIVASRKMPGERADQ